MTHLINNIYAIEIPNFSGIGIIDNQIRWYANFGIDNWIKLPEGNWEIIGLAHEVTEEVAVEIVSDDYGKLADFEHEGMIYSTVKESLSSLLHSKGLNGNVLLIKKID